MIKIQKGTKDLLPSESYKWHYIEDMVRRLAKDFGIREIRTPTFEATELFARGVGDTTDIVNKEMYTFDDKGGRSITLKPEGTAGVARCFVENSLENQPQPTKMYYLTSVFRYERPQSGRLREHHQFGVEYYGSAEAISDAEVILIAKTLFERLGIKDVKLCLNNIGCGECRKKYNEELKKYLRERKDKLCPLCQERMEKNPLRVLDCKCEECQEVTKDAPVTLDYLCDDCKNHFASLQKYLTAVGVDFEIDPHIVRGLDYYTGTVFEFVSTNIGAKGTVCGGGRYNNLVSEVGGNPIPAIGFGMGIERLLMVMETSGIEIKQTETPEVYIAPLGEAQSEEALKLTMKLRRAGISADTDLLKKSVKAQMKYADKTGYHYVIVLGEDELKSGTVFVKDMKDKEMGFSCAISELEARFKA